MPEVLQSMMVYLTSQQKSGLEARARSKGTKVAAEIRSAIDAYLVGVSPRELELLDVATRRAEQDIREMIAMIDTTNSRIAKRHAATVARWEQGMRVVTECLDRHDEWLSDHDKRLLQLEVHRSPPASTNRRLSSR